VSFFLFFKRRQAYCEEEFLHRVLMIMSSDSGQKPNRLAHEKSPYRARLNN